MWEEYGRNRCPKNVEGEIIIQKEGMTMYKKAGQCGDGPCGNGSQRLERKNRGQSRREDSFERSQIPPRVVALLLQVIMMMKCRGYVVSNEISQPFICWDNMQK
jgi:hypothetical protein